MVPVVLSALLALDTASSTGTALPPAQGRRTTLSNGFYGDLDLSGAPDDNVKVPSRGVQEFAGGLEEPISPESNHTGDSDGTGDSYVKVDSPEQDSPGLPERCVKLIHSWCQDKGCSAVLLGGKNCKYSALTTMASRQLVS